MALNRLSITVRERKSSAQALCQSMWTLTRSLLYRRVSRITHSQKGSKKFISRSPGNAFWWMRQLWRQSWELQHVSSGPVKAELLLIWKKWKSDILLIHTRTHTKHSVRDLAAGELQHIKWLDTITHLRSGKDRSWLWVWFLFHDGELLRPTDCEKFMQRCGELKVFYHMILMRNRKLSIICILLLWVYHHLQKILTLPLVNQHMMSSGSGWGREFLPLLLTRFCAPLPSSQIAILLGFQSNQDEFNVLPVAMASMRLVCVCVCVCVSWYTTEAFARHMICHWSWLI